MGGIDKKIIIIIITLKTLYVFWGVDKKIITLKTLDPKTPLLRRPPLLN